MRRLTESPDLKKWLTWLTETRRRLTYQLSAELLSNWLTVCKIMIGFLTEWQNGCVANLNADRQTECLTNRLTLTVGKFTNSVTRTSVKYKSHVMKYIRLTAVMTDWLTCWLADWLTRWLTDWLTDWRERERERVVEESCQAAFH